MTPPRRAVYPSGCITRTAAENLPHRKAFPFGGRWRGTRRMRGKRPVGCRTTIFYRPVGRGDPTLPGGLPARLRYRDATCRDAGCLKPALRPLRCFYPRPPWGGRPRNPVKRYCVLSISIRALRGEGDKYDNFVLHVATKFLSTPSAGRATCARKVLDDAENISIHALRGEGDVSPAAALSRLSTFLSTPSVGRATLRQQCSLTDESISIHALRGEGDLSIFRHSAVVFLISIHALRGEGDRKCHRVK